MKTWMAGVDLCPHDEVPVNPDYPIITLLISLYSKKNKIALTVLSVQHAAISVVPRKNSVHSTVKVCGWQSKGWAPG